MSPGDLPIVANSLSAEKKNCKNNAIFDIQILNEHCQTVNEHSLILSKFHINFAYFPILTYIFVKIDTRPLHVLFSNERAGASQSSRLASCV